MHETNNLVKPVEATSYEPRPPTNLKFILTNPAKILDFMPPMDGVVAQLVERLNGIQEVRGSNPLGSTILVTEGLRDGYDEKLLPEIA